MSIIINTVRNKIDPDTTITPEAISTESEDLLFVKT